MTATIAPPKIVEEAQAMRTFARKLFVAAGIEGPLAVLDFEVSGGAGRLGKTLAKQLSARLAEAGGVRVLDSVHVREILNQQVLTTTGLPEPVELKQLAAALGARQIVVGTATCTGQKVLLQAYVVEPIEGTIASRARTIVGCP